MLANNLNQATHKKVLSRYLSRQAFTLSNGAILLDMSVN